MRFNYRAMMVIGAGSYSTFEHPFTSIIPSEAAKADKHGSFS